MKIDPTDRPADSSDRRDGCHRLDRAERPFLHEPSREPGFRPSPERLERLKRLLLATDLGLAPREVVARRMTRCGIHPAIVAAYVETGLLFRAETLHEATTEDLVDWHRASLAWEAKTGGDVLRCWIAEEEFWRLAEREEECGEEADVLAWAGAGAEPAEGGRVAARRRRPR